MEVYKQTSFYRGKVRDVYGVGDQYLLMLASNRISAFDVVLQAETGWLGVVRIAMGWPLTAVAALATFVCIRAAQRAVRRGSAEWTGA